MPVRIINEIAHGFPLSITFADVSTPTHPLIYANPAFCALTGYDQVEILGRNCRFLQGEGTSAHHIETFSAAIKAGEQTRVSVVNYRKNGERFINDVCVEPVRDATGAPVLYLGTQRDEAEPFSREYYEGMHDSLRKAIALKKSEILSARQFHGSLTQAVLQTLPSRVIATDNRGLVAFANRAALMLLERPLYEVIGKPLSEVLRSADIARWTVRDVQPGEHKFALTWQSPSGATRELLTSVVCLDSRRDDEVSRVFVFRDIAEWQRQESHLRHVHGVDALKEMAAGFAHEIRNPLAAMRAIATELRELTGPGDDRYDGLTRMVRHVDRIDELVRHALRFGRPTPPKPVACEVESLITGALNVLGSQPLGLLRIPWELEHGLPKVRTDESHATEILINLIENALDSVGDAQRVSIRAYADEDTHLLGPYVRIDVRDDGPGIALDDLPRVFDPFFSRKPKAMGMGLALAQRLTRENGGHLLVTSVPNVETVFSLLLPIAESNSPRP